MQAFITSHNKHGIVTTDFIEYCFTCLLQVNLSVFIDYNI